MEMTLERKHEVRKEQIMLPLIQVLDEVTPKSSSTQRLQTSSTSITDSLNDLFPEQLYENKEIQRTKEVLGEQAKSLSPEQLRDITTEVKFLVESWLDDFERQTFNGLTLKELLHEKGGK